MGCTQRECDTSKDIEENYRIMFASRTCAGAKGKLFCSGKFGADISLGLLILLVMQRNV